MGLGSGAILHLSRDPAITAASEGIITVAMAECQDKIPYDAALLTALEASLSQARLAPYLAASSNDLTYALQRYLWNARIAKAFLFPLQVVEITVRNSVHNALSSRFGSEDWIKAPPQGFLTQKSEDARLKALSRLAEGGKLTPSPDEIVATLTFDFWSNLFRVDYKSTWEDITFIRKCFPNMESPYDWRYIQNRTRRVNALRNRIAHHEPIWNEVDLNLDFEKCLELVNMSSKETRKWVQRNSTVHSILRSPPTKTPSLPGLSLSAVTFEEPVIAVRGELATSIIDRIANKRPSAAIIDDGGKYYIIDSSSVLNGIASESKKADGYVDLNSIKIDDISDHWHKNIILALNDITTGDIASMFYPLGANRSKRPSHAIISDARGKIIGIIEKPSIRYR
ncbi:Abi family protein [Caulobacter sp. Root1472]|uniref:Abi family protein n=1 Tax=Caulobacter sp. Root1472 TaxID=1736470 RepID=UPI0012E3F7EA|nr:Abi family protein [Caulobacter sp. Root1472]